MISTKKSKSSPSPQTFNFLLFLLILSYTACGQQQKKPAFFKATDSRIQYTGRVDFSDSLNPRFWAPGTYIKVRFRGSSLQAIMHDEEQGGQHNYLELTVDNKNPRRIQTTGKIDTVNVAKGLDDGPHTATITKDTEGSIGYLELTGFRAQKLLPIPDKPQRKIEFIGDSITCGTGSDQSEISCKKGKWYDQHNAYMSYGPVTARKLHAQWHITAVSGIGLMHSCCNMNVLMPRVFDNMDMRADSLKWDFSRYAPDVVTIALGQNDGIQDSTAFGNAYVRFIKQIRSHYPQAQIVCLTSPMANQKLNAFLQKAITGVVGHMHQIGDNNVSKYFFPRSYNGGCDNHPDKAQHQLIAGNLTTYLKGLMHW